MFDYIVPENYNDLSLSEKLSTLNSYSSHLSSFKAFNCTGNKKDKITFGPEETNKIKKIMK